MSILEILNNLIIKPISIIYEIIFSISYYLSDSAGLSIVVLSLVVNFVLLPLFNRSDEVQKEESKIQEKLKPGVDHIKKVFKGDEQYMILSTYYRQNNYNPIYSLRSSISLLLEIPFFIAAYNFLANLPLLNGSSFLMIKDLGVEDGLLGGVNMLPILMTFINLLSVIVFTGNKSIKANLQLYIMALAFLVLLYHSPSGLVVYWTCNNLFSLIKNIIIKLNIKHFIEYFASFASLIFLFLGIRYFSSSPKQLLIVAIGFIALNIPSLILLFKDKINIKETLNNDSKVFFISTLILTILVGLFIPTSVIKASPTEFIDSFTLKNPLMYILTCFLISSGLFLIWLNIYYSLMDEKIKKYLNNAIFALAVITIGDYLFFGINLGTMSNTLVYDKRLFFSFKQILINIAFILITLVVVFLLRKHLRQIGTVILVALMSVSVFNIYNIQKSSSKGIADMKDNKEKINSFSIDFSSSERNVVILMMDRAIGSYFPFLLEEKPELKEQFKGFTYYPNTISFAHRTIFASPSLFGGYEYTPLEINKRNKEPLRKKHNEALRVLPLLFDENGFDVTVCDAPLADYSWIPDMSNILDDHQSIRKYTTMGSFRIEGYDDVVGLDILNRNMFVFSLMKSCPLIMQKIIYNDGRYLNVSDDKHHRNITAPFLDSYAVLDNFIDRTKISNSASGNVFILSNEATHSPVVLQEPDYQIERNVNNAEYDKKHAIRRSMEGKELSLGEDIQYRHYMCNMATMLKLGEWFDYLRELGVYDNTRIIIVSDHGESLHQFKEYMISDNPDDDIMRYNPLLLVKDFDSDELSIDYTFMTNADVPWLSMKDLIEKPINPYSGKVIDDHEKHKKLYVSACDKYDLSENQGNEFHDAPWFEVDGNALDKKAWRKIDNISNKEMIELVLD